MQLLRDALETDPHERDAFVSLHCGDDVRLRERVDSLLRGIAADDLASIDDAAFAAAAGAIADDPLLGRSLGRFRVAERIGRGGMGVVYRGVRDDGDFSQTVALKLIRRGFDFDDIRARFLRERRILARLSHPNLARFIDGGVADDGRPWFALEFVRGETITRWCDDHRLDIRARVRMFLEVCAAVQYAHTQLVVHRDLKPGNVLVDETGQVRLLDFGIARLLGGDDDAPALTTIGMRHALTPEYAAPEQFGGEPAGVATDVYALGVILYELIAGVLPYVLDRRDAIAAERQVQETPPQALAQAIARSVDKAPADIANQRLRARATTLRAFRADVRGDLSRILDKALAKEPARRYPTVAAFGEDLQRWLEGAPVRVSGNRVGYRVGKFIQRHRVAVGFATLSLIAMLTGVVGMVWQVRETRLQRDAAEAEAERGRAVRDYLMLLFGDVGERGDADKSVQEVFKRGADRLFDLYRDHPDTGQNIALMLGEFYVHLGDNNGARALLQRLLAWPGIDANPDLVASARFNLAQAELAHGDTARARVLLDQAQAHWNDTADRHALDLNISRGIQAKVEQAEDRVDDAIATLHSAIGERQRLLSVPDRELATAIDELAVILLGGGRHEEALAAASESIGIYESLGLARSSAGLAALNNRASAEYRLKRFDAAIVDFRAVVALRRELFGQTTELVGSMNNLAVALLHQNRPNEAIPLLEDALGIAIAKDGEDGLVAFAPRRNLSDAYVAVGRVGDAEPLADASVMIGQKLGSASVYAGAGYATLARVRVAQGRKAEARVALATATAIFTALGKGGEVQLESVATLREKIAPTEK